MARREGLEELAKALREAGISIRGGRGAAGFPIPLSFEGEPPLVLELPDPPLVSGLNPESVGLAVLDSAGYCRVSWGLAKGLAWFDPLRSLLDSELSPWIEPAYRGVSASFFQQGFRFHISSAKKGAEGLVVLVTNAHEEGMARSTSVRAVREAEALRRFGRLLSMNQTLQPLCVAAVHELAANSKLAAALIWVLQPDRKALCLAASTGTNRMGVTALGSLAADGAPTCIAEMVAMSAQPLYLDNVRDHVMTRELEARFCYLQPGGISVHPLYIGGNVIGVLELLGREGDPEFPECHELFQTLAEHLALAVNSAMLFESVEKLANDDALTGIANHRTLQQFLQARLAEVKRTGGESGLLMIDVDHFRNFNEEEGHDVGDMVLRHVAQILRDSVRPYDLAARYGGEEFTIVLPGSDASATLMTAERVRRHVETMPITTRSGHVRSITVSIGCASAPAHGLEPSVVIQAADSALFRAKRDGRNRVVMAGGSQGSGDRFSLDDIWSLIPPRSRASAKERLERIEPLMLRLAHDLALSEKQVILLRALTILSRHYQSLQTRGRLKELAALHAAEPVRALLPSLNALDVRFDTAGSRIPILARVLLVLLAVDAKGEHALSEDSGRFDPEIVKLAAQGKAAA